MQILFHPTPPISLHDIPWLLGMLVPAGMYLFYILRSRIQK